MNHLKETKFGQETKLDQASIDKVMSISSKKGVDLNSFVSIDGVELIGEPRTGLVINANAFYIRMANEMELFMIKAYK